MVKRHIFYSISLLLLLIVPSLSVSGFSGEDVWDVDGQITYEVDLSINYNRDLTYASEQIYPPSQFPAYDVSDAKFVTKYTGIIAGDMVFQITTTNQALIDVLFGSNEIESRVDPTSGINDNGHKTAYFADTSSWVDGYATEYEETFDYEVNFVQKSETESYVVEGDQRDFSNINVNGELTSIPVFDIEIGDKILEYTDGDIDYYFEYQNLIQTHSVTNGVLLRAEYSITAKLHNTNERPYLDAFDYSFVFKAISISGVNVLPPAPDNTEENLLSFPFFKAIFVFLPILVKISSKRVLIDE